MKVPALKCSICAAVIWSQHRHDCAYCDCQKCFIDGGRAYTRVGVEPGVKATMGVLDIRTGEFTVDGDEDLFQ